MPPTISITIGACPDSEDFEQELRELFGRLPDEPAGLNRLCRGHGV